ncbi:siderophore-interacting protein [Leifsonia sp. NPDC058292]|uniref:siderophore-interacting protein n=1 Tax=Leifsonia sp. NPDC058292 TaxID=3346428 RepID=UPI0036DEC880
MSLLASPIVKTARPAYRPYRARVSRLTALTPHFTRVTFESPDFHVFGTDRLDQRIKILFPLDDGTLPALGAEDEASIDAGDWYLQWRALPDDQRCPFRTYTVRAVDPGARQVDVDFVSHGDGGPAARWLLGAGVGDEVIIVGPDERSIDSAQGIDWRPGAAGDLLLVGDETATPAIASILESLPVDRRVHAFIEVPSDGDRFELDVPAHFDITWLDRSSSDRGGDHGCELVPAIERWIAEHPSIVEAAAAGRTQSLDDVDIDREILWETPELTSSGFYAWIAGESATVKTIRRLLVTHNGVDRGRVAFMGYWRLGQAEKQA